MESVKYSSIIHVMKEQRNAIKMKTKKINLEKVRILNDDVSGVAIALPATFL